MELKPPLELAGSGVRDAVAVDGRLLDAAARLLVKPESFARRWERDQYAVMALWARLEARTGHRMIAAYASAIDDPAAAMPFGPGLPRLLRAGGHRPEAYAVSAHQLWAARDAGDLPALQEALGVHAENALLGEAISLLGESEALCRFLDDRDGLQQTIGRLATAIWCRELLSWTATEDDGTALLKAERRRIVRETGDLDARQDWLGAHAWSVPFWHEGVAERVLRNRIRLCRRIGHIDGLWSSLLMLARLVMDDGLWGEARQCSEEAEALCRRLGCPAGLQEALGFRGWVIVATEADEDPLPLFAEQLALRRRLGWGSALRAVAGEACQWNHYGLIPRVMEVGSEIARRLGDEEALVAWLSWITAAHSMDEDGLALIAERKALCLRLGDHLGLRDALLSEACELVALGRGDAALAICAEAEHVARSHGMDVRQVALGVARVLERTHGHLETLLAEREDLDEAAGLLTRQAAVALELKARRGVLKTTADREWVLRRYGLGGRLTLDVDPAELTLLW